MSLQTEEKQPMGSSDMTYKILYHNKGYIRLGVPSLRKLPWSYFYKNSAKSLPFTMPAGIKNFHINPFRGSIVITYEPDDIDILIYVRSMASDPAVRKIIKG